MSFIPEYDRPELPGKDDPEALSLGRDFFRGCEPVTARDVFPSNAPEGVLAGGQDKFTTLEWLANDDGALWLNDDGTESLPA
jgi:hypothetical protein